MQALPAPRLVVQTTLIRKLTSDGVTGLASIPFFGRLSDLQRQVREPVRRSKCRAAATAPGRSTCYPWFERTLDQFPLSCQSRRRTAPAHPLNTSTPWTCSTRFGRRPAPSYIGSISPLAKCLTTPDVFLKCVNACTWEWPSTTLTTIRLDRRHRAPSSSFGRPRQ